jgi:hypothetical protein
MDGVEGKIVHEVKVEEREVGNIVEPVGLVGAPVAWMVTITS